jgi:hypothetical protein
MKQFKLFSALILLGIFLYSCQDEESVSVEDDISSVEISSTGISIDYAKEVALNFSNKTDFSSDSYSDGDSLQLKSFIKSGNFTDKKIDKTVTVKDESDSAAIYIFTFEESGFVVVSASKKEYPILAYSSTETIDFEDVPEGFTYWLSMRKNRIQEYRNDEDFDIPTSTTEAWDAVAPSDDEETVVSGGTVYEEVGPLLQTTWSQGNGYNDLVPYLGCTTYEDNSNGYALTGCVATATTQIMRYWEYPSSYDWDIMPDIIETTDASSSGTLEVAQLMSDVGEAVDMSYGCETSGACVSDVTGALENTFGYSTDASYIDYSSSTVRAQLNLGYPVLMRGSESDAPYGHAWVCEGYQRTKSMTIHNPDTYYEYTITTISDFYLYMNWGWNEAWDGWFLSDEFNPNGYDFDEGLSMIINIYP